MRSAKLDSSGLGGKIGIGLAAIVLLAAIGLGIYGGMVVPTQHDVVKVLPDARFAR